MNFHARSFQTTKIGDHALPPSGQVDAGKPGRRYFPNQAGIHGFLGARRIVAITLSSDRENASTVSPPMLKPAANARDRLLN